MTSHRRSQSAAVRWPWLVLAIALVGAAVVRVPLVVNAEAHLDSDLAVDGLTLVQTIQGHWRWHYPGTPYMGSLPVMLSLPQALIWGPSSIALVSGGTVAFLLLTIATFLLARRAFGAEVAAWSLVPLVFASTGALWLSGRVTGGHVLTAAWHAVAFALLHACLSAGKGVTIVCMGLWCGLGIWLDSMFLATLAGLAPVALAAWGTTGRSWRACAKGLLFVPAFLIGAAPREIGRRLEPHDAYREQFEIVQEGQALAEHARILGLECLPRLIAGRRLPGFQADPNPAALSAAAPLSGKSEASPLAVCATLFSLSLFAAAIVALLRASFIHRDVPGSSVARGLLLSSTVIVGGFVTNRNIFNSDNYRYLVTLLVPWSIGFGLTLRGLARKGRGGLAAAWLLALVFAGLTIVDAASWYARFGWIDSQGRPLRKPVNDPALAWLDDHPEVRAIHGGYWDVYRLSFLTGGRVRGVPYSIFPDRFPEWSRGLPGGRPALLIARPTPEGQYFADRALRAGGRVRFRQRGLSIVSWPE